VPTASILHSTLHTLLSALYTLNSALCTPHFTFYTPLDTLHCSLHTILHFTLQTLQSPLHTLHTTLPSQHSTFIMLHTLHSIPFHIPQSTVHCNLTGCWEITWDDLRWWIGSKNDQHVFPLTMRNWEIQGHLDSFRLPNFWSISGSRGIDCSGRWNSQTLASPRPARGRRAKTQPDGSCSS
jgi:hypothetical protein